MWQDGTPLDLTVFDNWGTHNGVAQPDNGGSGDQEQDCVHLQRSINGNKWKDLGCNRALPYACKKPAPAQVETDEVTIALPTSCSEGWVQNGNQCFKAYFNPNNFVYHPDYDNFHGAKAKCESLSPPFTTMAVPHNDEEMEFLRSLVSYNISGGITKTYSFWVGVERLENLTLIDFTTGEEFLYNGSSDDLPFQFPFFPGMDLSFYKCFLVYPGILAPESMYTEGKFFANNCPTHDSYSFVCQHPIQA